MSATHFRSLQEKEEKAKREEGDFKGHYMIEYCFLSGARYVLVIVN